MKLSALVQLYIGPLSGAPIGEQPITLGGFVEAEKSALMPRGETVAPKPADREMPSPEALREAYEERVAIMVIDGGLSEEDAKREAFHTVRLLLCDVA